MAERSEAPPAHHLACVVLCAVLFVAGFAAGKWFWHAHLEPHLWGALATEAAEFAAHQKLEAKQ